MPYTTSGFLNNITGDAFYSFHEVFPEEVAPALEQAVKNMPKNMQH
jgi:hypothetical protein